MRPSILTTTVLLLAACTSSGGEVPSSSPRPLPATSAATAPTAAASPDPYPRGIYSFMWASDARRWGAPTCLELPYIDGITLITQWRLLEPAEGDFRFADLVDPRLAEAVAHGKTLNLGVFPGITSPEFATARSAMFAGRHIRPHGGELPIEQKPPMRFPLPWDEAYTAAWSAFVAEVARRYGDHPHVGYLSISGPSVTALEMTIRMDPSCWGDFRAAGYSTARYIDCWKRHIDIAAERWTRKPLCITLAPTIPDQGDRFDGTVWQAVEAYARQRLGTGALFKVGFLNATWWNRQKPGDHAKPLIDHLPELARSAWVGGELFWKVSIPGEAVNGPLAASLENGFAAGMRWFEVYQEDIGRYEPGAGPYQPFAATLAAAHDRLLVLPR